MNESSRYLVLIIHSEVKRKEIQFHSFVLLLLSTKVVSEILLNKIVLNNALERRNETNAKGETKNQTKTSSLYLPARRACNDGLLEGPTNGLNMAK